MSDELLVCPDNSCGMIDCPRKTPAPRGAIDNGYWQVYGKVCPPRVPHVTPSSPAPCLEETLVLAEMIDINGDGCYTCAVQCLPPEWVGKIVRITLVDVPARDIPISIPDQCRALCYAIESIPAGTEQTRASVLASELHARLVASREEKLKRMGWATERDGLLHPPNAEHEVKP